MPDEIRSIRALYVEMQRGGTFRRVWAPVAVTPVRERFQWLYTVRRADGLIVPVRTDIGITAERLGIQVQQLENEPRPGGEA